MLSFQNLIKLNRAGDLPVFLQISNGMTLLIKSGVLAKGARLPGTRALSESLGVHRKTVVSAYDELMTQGWIEVVPSRGTFVSNKLPIIEARKIGGVDADSGDRSRAGFEFYARRPLRRAEQFIPSGLTLDEGIPDVRIAPVSEVLRNLKSIVSRSYNKKYLSYGPVYGDTLLREVLAAYLHETRGMDISKDNILITRGSQMGMYLSAQMIIKPGDIAVVGQTNYIAANLTLQDAGAEILRVPVDDEGIDTAAIEELCKKQQIKAVFVTSHHHHPTTVTLSAERRLHLVQLAEKYAFAILEDDYDYDFHYQNAPLLPLASADRSGNVVYLGAICKIVAPAYRVGYMVASTDLIRETAHLRRIVDRQGDPILERAVAQMIQQGDFQRHSKKALKLYKERRDHFCELLESRLGEFVRFQIPEGGMAVWAGLDVRLSWPEVTAACLKNGLKIPNWQVYDQLGEGHNHIRMGFASLDFDEQEKVVSILERSMQKVKSGSRVHSQK
jgi:GntR family transcriptional regulator/MocR family aminotransferase